MTDVLAAIVADTRRRVAEREAAQAQPSGVRRRGRTGAFRAALAAGGPGHVSVIAEHKRASPSAGTIRDDLNIEDVVSAYERGGAAALSILTEESRFAGRLGDIEAARQVTALPILRKDFIVTPFQVTEAVGAGADAILLIVAAFPDRVEELHRLNHLARELGLDVLMEIHNADELDVALGLDPLPPVIGINNRNLGTLTVDLETTFTLAPRIPAGTLVVAESGFSTPEQIVRLGAAGVDAVLIGEALMRAPDIEAAARAISTAQSSA